MNFNWSKQSVDIDIGSVRSDTNLQCVPLRLWKSWYLWGVTNCWSKKKKNETKIIIEIFDLRR